MDTDQLTELLYQALETEIGGVQVYQTAIRCAVNDELKEEWEKYLEETEGHERILRETFEVLGMDPGLETPGRAVLRSKAQAMVRAMEMALETAGPSAAQLVAAESVVEAETKDHMNWTLIGTVVGKLSGKQRQALKKAHDQVHEQEDEHLYHTMGWARELWVESLGLPAKLPPAEEEREVKTMRGAAQVKEQRDRQLKRPASAGRGARSTGGGAGGAKARTRTTSAKRATAKKTSTPRTRAASSGRKTTPRRRTGR